MSSFIVEGKTINKVVTFLSENKDFYYLRSRIKKRLGIDLETDEGEEALARLMFEMNCKATGQRYANSEMGLDDFGPLNFKYKPYYELTIFSVLKSLSCWLYQCAEGDVYDSEEYRLFTEIKGDLAYHIVADMPQYEKATGWN